MIPLCTPLAGSSAITADTRSAKPAKWAACIRPSETAMTVHMEILACLPTILNWALLSSGQEFVRSNRTEVQIQHVIFDPVFIQ